MNGIFRKIVSCAAACVIACSAGAVSAFADDDWQELDQTEFTQAMGLGWNLGNQFEAVSGSTPGETNWGNPVVTEDLIKMVKDAGFTSIRVPVSYLSKIGDGPDYKVEEEWLDRVAEVVDYCVDNDLYVIINMHGDGYHTISGGWLFCDAEKDEQTEIKEKYKAVWTQIAERFKDYDEHLVFESMNEEFNNTYDDPPAEDYANINDYNQIFTDAVRSTGGNNAKRWLLIPGWNTSIDYTAGDYGFELPDDSKCEANGSRIAVSVHYYDPYGFVLDEGSRSRTRWGEYAKTKNKDNWGQEDYLEEQFNRLYEKFVSQGYPVIIGEFGAVDKTARDPSNNEYRRYWCEYVVKTAKAAGCIPVYWDNGWNGDNGLAVFDRSSLTVTQQDIIDGMIRAISSDEDYEIPAPAEITEDSASSAAESAVTDKSSETAAQEKSEPEETTVSSENSDEVSESDSESGIGTAEIIIIIAAVTAAAAIVVVIAVKKKK